MKPGQIPEALKIPSVEIEAAYREAFRLPFSFWWHIFRFPRNDSIFLADACYMEADEELIQMILDADLGDREEYEAEEFDCDDFAFRLMGIFHQNRETAAMPIFITWVSWPGAAHAVLSYYYDDQVRIIEPQNDRVFPVPEDWSLILLVG